MMYEENEAELSNLTDFQKRSTHIDDLKDHYYQINRLMMEAEDEKTKQMSILNEYKSMIDFGTHEPLKHDIQIQTDVSLTRYHCRLKGFNLPATNQ